MGDFFKCEICGNTDTKYIGYKNGLPYCRKCISFKGQEVIGEVTYPKDSSYSLNYELSDKQKDLSEKLILNYKKGINTLVHAVCGSGKTEIVLAVISYAIRCGERCGFTVPRRDVAIELHERFSSIFKNNKVTLVYGGHTNCLTGDLVCLTTHQLYRYENYFDLLIMDEVDAFPYKGSDVLESFFLRSLRGHYIMMSATPDDSLLTRFNKNGFDIVRLFQRFHKHPLPVPEVHTGKDIKLTYLLIKYLEIFKKQNKPVFVFAPTIEICESMYYKIHFIFKNGDYVHSQRLNRNEIISNFKSKGNGYLFTTAVLERGVTVKDLQVIIYKADHAIYDQYSLVQIAGRVGRKKDAPEGKVIYLANEINQEIKNSITDIKTANKDLQNVFQTNND